MERLLQSQAIQVRAGLELAGNETIRQAVMCGMGIMLPVGAHLPGRAGGRADGGARRDRPAQARGLVFVTRRDTVLGGVNAAFRDFVIAQGVDWARCRTL